MEIERSFLLEHDPPGVAERVERIDQGYLAAGPEGAEVRIRRRGGELTLTIKSLDRGAARLEEELAIDEPRFERLWPLTQGRRLQKERHVFALAGELRAEVDVYHGSLSGLRVVEVEFPSEQASAGFCAPAWFGREVTGDERYRNRALALAGRAPD
jgi:CYTH domain-containing protein